MGPMTRLRTRRRVVAVRVGVTAVALALGVGGLAGGDAPPPARVALQGGSAWVASSTVGHLTLIDGSSAEVAARVPLGRPSTDLGAVQSNTVGYAVDRAAGTVARVDPATFALAAPVAVTESRGAALTVHPSRDALYVVDHERGQVTVTDPGAVARRRGEPRSLAEPVRSSVVDGSGRLWTLGATSGDLTWFDGADRGARSEAVPEPAGAELAVLGGEVALVERSGRRVRALDRGGRFGDSTCLDIDPADESVEVGGSPSARRLYVVSGDQGVLRVSDLASGGCGDVAIEVAAPRSDLGVPREAQGRVFVPDYTTGTVVVVDVDDRQVSRTGELVTPGEPFELFDQDGIVFYNDPATERAGVVRVDGSFAAVTKYDPDRPGGGVDPDDGGDGGAADAPSPGTEAGVGDGAAGEAGGAAGSPDGADSGPETEGATPGPADTGTGLPPGSPVPPDRPPVGSPVPPAGGPGGRGPDDPGAGPMDGPGDPRGEGLVQIVAPAVVEAGHDAGLRLVATDGGAVRDVTWAFGDGGVGSGVSVSHAWEDPGHYVVSAQGSLDGVPAGDERTITVVEPSIDAPELSGIGWPPGQTFDDQAAIEFFATVQNPVTDCSWTIEGLTLPCATTPSGADTRVSVRHRFGAGGNQVVRVDVSGPGGADTATATVTVEQLVAPVPHIGVVGATGAGGSWTAPEGTSVTFDGSGTIGSYRDLLWHDSVTGATFSGSTWTPALGVGTHTITLTADSPAFGSPSTAVTINVQRPDTSAPTGWIEWASFTGGDAGYTVTAADAESGITSIAIYGEFHGACISDADPDAPPTPLHVGPTTSPLATGTGGQLVPDGAGEVTFTAGLTLCPAGTHFGADLSGGFANWYQSAWAVVTNGAGLTFTTDPLIIVT